MLTWKQLKELVDVELKAKNIEDIEIWTIDTWQPDKLKITIDHDYDWKLEKDTDELYLYVRDI